MDKELSEYLDVNAIVNQMESAFQGPDRNAYSRSVSEKFSDSASSFNRKDKVGGLDPILEENASLQQIALY